MIANLLHQLFIDPEHSLMRGEQACRSFRVLPKRIEVLVEYSLGGRVKDLIRWGGSAEPICKIKTYNQLGVLPMIREVRDGIEYSNVEFRLVGNMLVL